MQVIWVEWWQQEGKDKQGVGDRDKEKNNVRRKLYT